MGRETNRIPGQNLLVCAVLMGRPYYCAGRRFHRRSQSRFDSHIGYGRSRSPKEVYPGEEYVVFDSSQLLPLYVLHLNDGKKKENYSTDAEVARAAAAGPCIELK